MIFDVCIIGGGASGMAAAVTAAGQGCKVLILEKMDRLGRKILATGNGRCNLSNNRIIRGSSAADQGYHCSDPHFPGKVIASFDSKDALVFFGDLGIITASRGEYIYPASMQASTVRNSLEWAVCGQKNITVETGAAVRSSRYFPGDERAFVTETDDGRKFFSRKLIISCGGRSTPKLGSDGSGYGLCEGFGHHIVPVVPALSALRCSDRFFRKLAGVRTQAKVTLYVNGRENAHDTGELQLTSYGISGIPVFQLSRCAAYALENGDKAEAALDLVPDKSSRWLAQFIEKASAQHPAYSMSMILSGILNSTLAEVLTDLVHGDRTAPADSWDRGSILSLVSLIKSLRVNISASNGFDNSQVSAGGVDTAQIDPSTLSSLIVPGLYITGEVLDVDGICGGYNLQWAWATGYLAGRSAGRIKNDQN